MGKAVSTGWCEVRVDDCAPFAELSGRGKATQVFGTDLRRLLGEQNEALAA